jgi:hypothetical protein
VIPGWQGVGDGVGERQANNVLNNVLDCCLVQFGVVLLTKKTPLGFHRGVLSLTLPFFFMEYNVI